MHLGLVLVSGLLLATAQATQRLDGYRFFLDGTPFSATASLSTGRSGLGPGDVITVDNIELTIGEPGEYRFRSAREGVLLELPDGRTRWVAVRVERTYDDGPAFVDGLAPLSEDEVRGLWGLRAETWTASCAAKARWLDAERVFVALGQSASAGRDDLPELPAGLRRLRAWRFVGWKSLARLRQLEYLDVFPERAFDARLLTGFARLRSLELYARPLTNASALATLPALESLELAHQAVDDIGFVRALPALRHIGLRGTRVSDLSPLSGLERLEAIVATFAPLTRLPDGPLPSLRTLDIMLTPLTDDAVASFRQAHPDVRVRHRWNASLREALAGTTRVRLRAEPECSLEEAGAPRDIDGPSEIAELMAILVFEESAGVGICGCLGGTAIELHQGDGRVETLQLVCGVSIRWSGWPGDGQMSDGSQQALVDWLARHGVTGPRDELRETRAGLEVWARKRARAAAAMSPRLREAFALEVERASRWPADESWPAFRKALAADFPNAADRIAMLLRVMGAEMGSWRGIDAVDRVADDLLRTYRPAQLERACAAALRSDDRALRRGAARFWDVHESPVPRTLASDPALRSALLTAHQESRSAEVRQRALQLVLEWWGVLTPAERDGRLLAGLHDPSRGVRRQAIVVAGQAQAVAAAGVLLRVQAGEAIEARPLPSVPPEEVDSTDTSEDAVGGDSSDAELAAAALVRMGARAAARP